MFDCVRRWAGLADRTVPQIVCRTALNEYKALKSMKIKNRPMAGGSFFGSNRSRPARRAVDTDARCPGPSWMT
jgi:hypothetical protein